MKPSSMFERKISRRRALQVAGVTALGGAALGPIQSAAQMPRSLAEPDLRIHNCRIRQSIMGWTYDPMPTPELARLCKDIGLVAMEGVDRKHYPMIKELGLQISLVSSHGFTEGPCNRANHPKVIQS